MLRGYCSRRMSRSRWQPPVERKVAKPAIQIRACWIFNNIRRSALWQTIEEQFDLPAALVQGGDGQGRQAGVVGQEHQRLAGLGILEANAPQMLRVVLG